MFCFLKNFIANGNSTCYSVGDANLIEAMRYDSDHINWGTCRGTSDYSKRGTTCGVW